MGIEWVSSKQASKQAMGSKRVHSPVRKIRVRQLYPFMVLRECGERWIDWWKGDFRKASVEVAKWQGWGVVVWFDSRLRVCEEVTASPRNSNHDAVI